ncbi:MAG TPA: hypothetical protein VJ859_14845 [Allosphingosinicella sp.]|nr:hypothetical protein [Allosphingosinicella sp.]
MAAHRCWVEEDDELLVMIDGEVVLVEEQGETARHLGDCVAFPKGVPDGHQLLDRSDRDFVAIGTTANGTRYDPDVDLVWGGPRKRYTHKDGTSYRGHSLAKATG